MDSIFCDNKEFLIKENSELKWISSKSKFSLFKNGNMKNKETGEIIEEQWKNMKSIGIDNYLISSFGRFYNIESGKILLGSTWGDFEKGGGYVRVSLDGKYYLVHILVAIFFLNNGKEYDGKLFNVDHLDNIGSHNYVMNLELVEKGENIKRSGNNTKTQLKRNCNGEIWKSVRYSGFENISASNFGRISNTKTGKQLRVYGKPNSYQTVNIAGKEKHKTFYVHQLVASAFLEDWVENYIKDNLVIDHIDGVKNNNSSENLQIISNSDNLIKFYNDNKK